MRKDHDAHVLAWLATHHSAHVLAWRQSLAAQWMGLPMHVAKKLHFQGRLGTIPLIDAAEAGVLALVKASHDFNPSRGFKFNTLAYAYIRNAIINHIRDTIRRHQQGEKHPARTPRNFTDLAPDIRDTWLRLHSPEDPPRLDPDQWSLVLKKMSQLPDHHCRCVKLVFLEQLTLREAGRQLGCSGESARQYLHSALRQLKKWLRVPCRSTP